MDINPSLQIHSKEQVFDKGIRQKWTKRVNPFIVCCADCWPWSSCLRGVNACIHVIHIYVTPRFACWQVNRQNSQKSEYVLRRSPIGGTKTFCVSTRHPAQTGFKASSTTVAETWQKTKCQAFKFPHFSGGIWAVLGMKLRQSTSELWWQKIGVKFAGLTLIKLNKNSTCFLFF